MMKAEISLTNWIGRDDMDLEWGMERTIHQQKHSVYDLSGSPTLKETHFVLIERKVGKPFRYCIEVVASKSRSRICKKGHTGS